MVWQMRGYWMPLTTVGGFFVRQEITSWPFAEAETTSAITSRHVAGGAPIVFATRALEDGAWIFLDTATIEAEDQQALSLSELARLDPTILELAELPLGWQAARRSIEEPWISYPRCC
jgi:hypothetical protein